MEGVSRYILSISAAAIICAIAKATVDEKSAGGAMIRLIAGLIMAFTVISPVVDIDFGDLPVLTSNIIIPPSSTKFLRTAKVLRSSFSSVR